MTPTRRLAAIMAADVAGFSAAMERDEEGTFALVQELRRTIVEPKIAEHQGRLIKTTGDGFLAEFASPIAAMRCALTIQAAGEHGRVVGGVGRAGTCPNPHGEEDCVAIRLEPCGHSITGHILRDASPQPSEARRPSHAYGDAPQDEERSQDEARSRHESGLHSRITSGSRSSFTERRSAEPLRRQLSLPAWQG